MSLFTFLIFLVGVGFCIVGFLDHKENGGYERASARGDALFRVFKFMWQTPCHWLFWVYLFLFMYNKKLFK